MTMNLPDPSTMSLSYPDVTMGVWAPSMAALYGDRPAIVDGERVCTYRELDERSAQFASALQGAGVAPRDVVLLHVGNCIEFIVAYYGALRAGATVTLVNPLQPEPGLRKQIEETGAVAAVTQPQQLGVLLGAAAGTTAATIVVVSDEPVEVPPPPRPSCGTTSSSPGSPRRSRRRRSPERTSRTWPSPAVPPASPRACACCTATWSPT